MLDKYIAKHSLLTSIGAVLFFGCMIVALILNSITDDKGIGVSSFIFGVVGGLLIMLGLIYE